MNNNRHEIVPLIPKSSFVGLDDTVNLCAGGETPMLVSHQRAIDQFMLDKSKGEHARHALDDRVDAVRAKCGQLWSVDGRDIAFLANASEGINNVVYGLEWRAGDNVIVADVEFPSGILPWTRLQRQGVEVRVVRHRNWKIELEDIAALIDERTRVVEISHVSMFTGQRLDLAALSALVRSSNALLLLDATHASGVVPVDAGLADVVVSSCYKWLLGVHGAALFYVNPARAEALDPPFLGWNSPARHGGWEDPLDFELQPTALRHQAGNAGFLPIYILDNALDHLLDLGIERIESHALALSGRARAGIAALGFELMTPAAEAERAGNVCFMVDDLAAVQRELQRQKVLVWGSYAGFARLRISTHVYNGSNDVDRCLEVLQPFGS
jgi:selenocysteine lyase/cysteine desulfurase